MPTWDVVDGDSRVMRARAKAVDDVIDAQTELVAFVTRKDQTPDGERALRTLGHEPVVDAEG